MNAPEPQPAAMGDLFAPPSETAGPPKSAILSPCRRYRYQLWRRWGAGKAVVFIGLNPSTADEFTDDPTIRKCVAYAKRWGYAGLGMVNLFAFRATQPDDMRSAADPIGPDNMQYLLRACADAGLIIAAWGAHGSHLSQDKRVVQHLKLHGITPHCLHLTKDGQPGHPLYLRGDAEPQPYHLP